MAAAAVVHSCGGVLVELLLASMLTALLRSSIAQPPCIILKIVVVMSHVDESIVRDGTVLSRYLADSTFIAVIDVRHVRGPTLAAARAALRKEGLGHLWLAGGARRLAALSWLQQGDGCMLSHWDLALVSDVLRAEEVVSSHCGVLFLRDVADLSRTMEIFRANVFERLPRVGELMLEDLVALPGDTGLDPSRTQYFAALNIPSKITKGRIEIVCSPQGIVIQPKGTRCTVTAAAASERIGIMVRTAAPTIVKALLLTAPEESQHSNSVELSRADVQYFMDGLLSDVGVCINNLNALRAAIEE